MADCVVFGSGKNIAFKRARMPRETVAFSFKTDKDEIRRALCIRLRHRGVLGAIKHINWTHDGARRDQVRVLRHISRSIDFTIMRDLLGDGQLAFSVSVAAFLGAICRGFTAGIDLVIRHVYLGNLQIIWFAV